MTWQVIQADCIEAMSEMDEASVDAIVTDPPYSLSFMGKAWDHNLNHGPWAIEALRVLKPGGHLLAFGGTRTYHRLACALEDAGFEIRDCLAWMYGQGFAKSLNLDNLKESPFCRCSMGEWDNDSEGARAHLPDVRDRVLPVAIQEARSTTADLFAPMQGQTGRGPTRSDRSVGSSGLDSRPAGEIWVGEPGLGATDGSEGRLHHGASLGDGSDVWSPPDANGSGEPHRPQPSEQHAEQPGTVADERGSQTRRGWPICARCGKPRIPRGLGTALKPAYEPVVLARKPLIGTVAANVLEHGTGALNIDGTRIETSAADADAMERVNTPGSGRFKPGKFGSAGPDGFGAGRPLDTSLGRWPANVILDEEVASGHEWARYFYVPKADREERNRGLEHLTQQPTRGNYGDGIQDARPHMGADYVYEAKAANNHPTVKPVELMRWLCRLITPPGGTVLDPFTGSGSTGIAALREGFNFIGIEREADYVEIARDRIRGDAPLFNIGAEA